MGAKTSHNHTGRVHSQRIIDRYDQMTFGERDHFTRINRLDPKKPSYAIIVGSNAGGGKGHVHPFEPREVTPRESARMQCFPDWWWFSGTSRHPIRQVGNAVPTLLGFAVGRQVMVDIFDGPKVSTVEAIEKLGQSHLFTKAELKKLEEKSQTK
jgi:DNA (cytosine-5)-methyltransferase 1